MRDNGVTKDPTIEVNIPDDPAVRYIPTLREVSATLPNGDLGLKFTFELLVSNREGTIAAERVCFLFATVPPQPNAPTVLHTTSSSITVQYTVTDNGHATITSYHL